MTSRYYTMTDSTGESGFLPTVVFDGSSGVFTSAHRINTLSTIGITGFYEADFTNTVTTIDVSAFAFDTKVVVATINGVTTIGNNAFNGCSALRSITLDTSVNTTTKKYLLTSIGTSAFQNCISLRNLHIPDTVRIIPDNMCNGCTGLEVAVMGYGCDRTNNSYNTNGTIGQSAFANCSTLSYFVVPETVSSIGSNAFANDSSLALVTILGRPTISANAFTTAMNTNSAVYTFDNSASYTDLSAVTNQTLFPTLATKRAYLEIELSGAAELTFTLVSNRLTALNRTAANSWWKGKILSTVTSLSMECFRAAASPNGIGTTNFSNMVGLSFPSGLTSIGYTAFGNSYGTNPVNCNVVGYYFPTSVTTFPTISAGNYAFYCTNADGRTKSSTRQIVFQSGNSTVTFTAHMFLFNPAMAIIAPNVTSFGANCFEHAKNVQLYSFFQKNAYTATTRLDGPTDDSGTNAFTWNFDKGVAGYTHYLYIPKQITRMALDLFRGLRDKIYVTVYHNTISTAGVTSAASGLGFGFLTHNATDTANARFTGTGPSINIIYNYFDANGATLLVNSGINNSANFSLNLLYPSGVTTINKRFNDYTWLRSVAVDHNASQTVFIIDAAFINCVRLNYVYLNNRVKTIGVNAFRNAPLSSSFDLIDAAPLEAIYHAAFISDDPYTCNIVQITIPKTVKALGSFVFGCQSNVLPEINQKFAFTKLSFEDGIEFWGDYNNDPATAASNTLTAYEVNNTSSLKYMAIPAHFCQRCYSLQNVSFLNTAIDLLGTPVPADGNGALARPDNGLPIPTRYNTQILTNKIKRIGNHAFIFNRRLQSIRIPDGVTTIDAYSFYDAYSLTYLYLPDSLTTMGLAAFNFMNSGNEFGYTGKQVSVRLPQKFIDNVFPNTFSGDTGYFNPYNSTTRYFTVAFDDTSTSGKVTNGVLQRFTSQAQSADNFFHIIIESGISGIRGGASGTAAFDGFTSLKTVTIPDTVTDIGLNAFLSCTGLTNIFISPTSNLTFIGESAINNCTSLTSFFIPNSLKRIENNAFNASSSLATVTYGDNPGLKFIGPQAFYRTTKALTSIFIPSSVVHIGNRAFITADTDINVLNTVTFGAGSRLKSIDSECFGFNGNGIPRAAQYLRDIVLPSSLRYIGPISSLNSSLFQNTHRLAHSANLVVPSSVEVIPWAFLFADNTPAGSTVDISNVYFPRSITNVAGPRVHNGYSVNLAGSSSSFAGAEFFASRAGSLIYLPSELSAYTGYSGYSFPSTNRARSFYKTMSFTDNPLTRLNLGLSIVNTTDHEITSQIHADIKEGVTVIGNGTDSIAGEGTIRPRNLISVNIPSSVTTIRANAFSGSSALAYVTFSENSKLSTIGDSAFLGCATIHDIQLPNSLTTIGANAFNGCYNLASISIPYNVTSIGAGAFNVNINTPTTDIVRPGGHLAYQLGQDIYGEAISDYSGWSVSLSQDGKILAIGSIYNDGDGGDAGQVRVYKYQTIADATWANYTVNSFSQNGTAPFNKPIVVNGGDAFPVSGKYYWVQLGSDINGESGYAGYSVSLSSDGTTVAIGALLNNAAGTDAGQVRVYKYQTVTDANWTNYTINSFTYTGTAPTNKPIIVNGGDANPVSGKFYWVQLGGDIDGVANSQSGNSVALNSNGTIVVIGARYADIPVTDGGSVRIYQYNGSTTWNQLGSTITGGVAISDMIGYSVAISDDGFTIAYGAPKFDTNGGDRGLVNIFKWNGTTWNQVGGTHIQGELDGDNFGESVSLSSDGTIVAIGAFANDGGGSESTGHVRVYKYNGTSWNKLGQDIDGLAAYDHFGNSVSLSSDGTILAVGSRFSDTGTLGDTGLARIYKFFNGTWQKLGQDIRGEFVSDQAGWSVSLSKDGTTVAIGSIGNDSNGYDSGKVRVYQISNFTVRLHKRLYDTIHGSFSTYFPGISPGAVQVIPELQLTNTLNPAKLTISQINNLYIRYRQSQLGFCSRVTVAASSGGTLTNSDVTNALSGTTGLVHLDISTNVTIIEAEVCLNNSRIYSVAIPKTVTNIRFSAFNTCTNLTYLSFHPDSVCTSIDTYAFHNTRIYDLVLPDSLIIIGIGAFRSCFNLTSVCVPKNVTSLNIDAFSNCSKLTSVALPSHLSTANTSSYFTTNGSTVPGTFTIYDTAAAIPHFKLSDYSMPSGIVQTVIDSAVTYIDHRAYAYYPDITLYAVTTNKQTQTAGQYNYVMNGIKMPFQPAAFLLNGAGFGYNSMFPLYRSIPDLNVFSLSNAGDTWPANSDDLYILMPGYSICIYNNLYDEENLFTASPTERYFDNEFGKVPLNITLPSGIPNTTSSVLIMYKGRILSKYFST